MICSIGFVTYVCQVQRQKADLALAPPGSNKNTVLFNGRSQRPPSGPAGGARYGDHVPADRPIGGGVPTEAKGQSAICSFLDLAKHVQIQLNKQFSQQNIETDDPLVGGRCRRPGLPSGVAESMFCCRLASAKGIVPRARARTSPEPKQE